METDLTLGIATIGDLLLNNRISNTENKKSIEDIKLKIPVYQIPYKWKVKNCNQLLNDIKEAMNANKEVYRVGTLILHHDEEGEYNIVDGQQRTITFCLLLASLKQDQIKLLDENLLDDPYNIHNIINNYRAFERQVAKILDDKERDTLVDYITNHCELIVVITEDQSEAFQFFDSQNARGKALYPHDLLKAYHLREMQNINDSETERIVKMWEELDQKKLAALFRLYPQISLRIYIKIQIVLH